MAAEAGCAVLHSCQLTGSMVIYQLSDAYDSPLVDAPVRGRFVGTLGPVATLLHTLLVHDVSLATQASLAGRKGLNSISALLLSRTFPITRYPFWPHWVTHWVITR